MSTPPSPPPSGRAAALIAELSLQPHPEGGWYREFFRSEASITSELHAGPRRALTSIDFLLVRGQHSAWHRVASDEAWHLLEGDGLRLWLMPPAADRVRAVDLGPAGGGRSPRHVVPADWWQAAEPLGDYAYVGATVGPGFEFADFGFLRGRGEAAALRRLDQALERLL